MCPIKRIKIYEVNTPRRIMNRVNTWKYLLKIKAKNHFGTYACLKANINMNKRKCGYKWPCSLTVVTYNISLDIFPTSPSKVGGSLSFLSSLSFFKPTDSYRSCPVAMTRIIGLELCSLQLRSSILELTEHCCDDLDKVPRGKGGKLCCWNLSLFC